MQEVLKSMLSQHAVRIRQNDNIVGTGFLIVPKDGENAYIITAAHVLCTYSNNLNLQFLGITGQSCNTRSVSDDMTIIHNNYQHEHSIDRVQYCDVACIRISKEEWMDTIAPVFWGVPKEEMPIEAVGFASVNFDSELPHGSVSHNTVVRLYTPDTHRISATIQGDFILNNADLDNDIQGMSGTVFAAKGQDAVIIIGMMVATTGKNAAFGQLNIVDMMGLNELLKGQGILLEKKNIQPVPKENMSADMDTEDFIGNRHFVHRNTELEHIKNTLQSHRHIVLCGMGGIGKTELAREYAKINYHNYRVVHQINCTDGAAIGFSQLVIPEIERSFINNVPESDESLGRRKLTWLHKQKREYLLILDDLSPRDLDIDSILSLPLDRIITSRWDVSSWNCQVLKVDALASSTERKYLFESYLEQKLSPEEDADFKVIDKLVEGHTLTLQLIALQCFVTDTPLSLIRSALESQGVYTDDPNVFTYGNSVQEKNTYGHIRTIWNLATLQNRQSDIMQALSLLSPANILRTECRDWLGLGDLNDVNHLIRSGWVQYQRINGKHSVRVHAVIADVVCHEKCRSFPEHLSAMINIIHNKLIDRDLNIEERMHFIYYGEQLARRLPVCKEAIKFIQDLSMEEESIRQYGIAHKLLECSGIYLQQLELQSDILQADNDSDIGIVFQGERKYSNARAYLRKARKAYEALCGIYPERYGVHLYNEARLLQEMKLYEDAFKLAQKAKDICMQYAPHYLGKTYDVIANHYSHLAHVEERLVCISKNQDVARRHYDKCRKYIQKECDYWRLATDTKEQYNCDKQYDVMVSKSYLACTQALLRNKDAHTTIQSVLQFYVRTTGERSSYVAHTYDLMCMIYEKLDDLKKSTECGQKSAEIYIELYGPDTIELDSVYHNLIISFKRMKDKAAVEYYTQEQRRIVALSQ